MKVAIVHYWLLGMRGGEKVVEGLCRVAPSADLFTLFYEPDKVSEVIRGRRVTVSFLNPLRGGYRSLLPLMPLALEAFDLRGYDLVVSSESGPAKGVITGSGTRHVCYCHTPMRYLWDLYPEYLHEWTRSRVKKVAMGVVGNYLRVWDFAAAARVDEFVANSENVRRRVWKTYRRDAEVVHPPVDVDGFRWEGAEDYYLIVSELVAYKRVDLAVRVFSGNGRRLKIVGDGPEFSRLRKAAGGNVEFCGRVSDEELRGLYARCRALVMPQEEDFGITAVEAIASGKAVIALGRGGVLEIVPEFGAFLFDAADEEGLNGAILRFEGAESGIDSDRLREASRKFSAGEFDRKMRLVLYRE